MNDQLEYEIDKSNEIKTILVEKNCSKIIGEEN